jgi:hypothetical protein
MRSGDRRGKGRQLVASWWVACVRACVQVRRARLRRETSRIDKAKKMGRGRQKSRNASVNPGEGRTGWITVPGTHTRRGLEQVAERSLQCRALDSRPWPLPTDNEAARRPPCPASRVTTCVPTPNPNSITFECRRAPPPPLLRPPSGGDFCPWVGCADWTTTTTTTTTRWLARPARRGRYHSRSQRVSVSPWALQFSLLCRSIRWTSLQAHD